MKAFRPKFMKPEAKIQRAIIKMLEIKGWMILVTHGSMYQSGFPDLYACHKNYRPRWIEVKNPKNYRFTQAQLDTFPKLCECNAGVWIMVEASDTEYDKLFKSPNWYQYLKL